MDLNQKLVEAINPNIVFTISIFGYKIPVSDAVVAMWLIMAFLVAFSYILTRGFETIPKGKQNFIEILVEGINNFAKNNIGHHWKHYAAYIGTILLFLVLSNTLSIFNVIPGDGFKLKPPTKNINVTMCMAFMSISLVLLSGIRFKKFSGWIKSFVEPSAVILPFKILEYFLRPFSLSLRLFGNILGAFIVMELVYIAVPIIFPAAVSIYFDLFDGILQAYIFVFLTSLYVAETIE